MFKEPEGEDWLTEVEDEEYDDWKAACEKGRYVVYSSLAQFSTYTRDYSVTAEWQFRGSS